MPDMTIQVGQLAEQLDQWFPRHLAASWDNTGLLVGNRRKTAKMVLCCLTVTLGVLKEAVALNADLIVSHHPVMFKPIQSLTCDSIDGQILLGLCQHGIAVYSPHTSHDGAHGGINEQLATLLNLSNCRPLTPAAGTQFAKLVVFSPPTHVDTISRALFAAGAGTIGKYNGCSFRSPGKGTFLGSPDSQPAIGQPGQSEIVEEVRLEVIFKWADRKTMESIIRANHPYEEPAFDIVPLAPRDCSDGDGRIGELAEPLPLSSVVQHIDSRLPCEAIQVLGPLNAPIRTIAIGCGAAGEWVKNAHRQGADLFLTGEMRYHDQLWAQQAGISVIIAGHHATEAMAIPTLAERIHRAYPGLDVAVSRTDHAPSYWLTHPEKTTSPL